MCIIHFLGVFARLRRQKKKKLLIDFSFDIVYNRTTNFLFGDWSHLIRRNDL